MTAATTHFVLAGLFIFLLPPPSVAAGKKQQEAAALLARARELLDLRTQGSPSFRFRAHVRVLADSGQFVEGTYLLVWAGPDQWREEIRLADYEESNVVHNQKLWKKRSLTYWPVQAVRLAGTLHLTGHLELDPEETISKMRDRKWNQIRVRCVRFLRKRIPVRELCFDPGSGDFLWGELRDTRIELGNYMAVSGKRYPGMLRAFEKKKLVAEIAVEELTAGVQPDPSLFAPLPEAEAWAWCENPEPQEMQPRPSLAYPYGTRLTGVTGPIWLYAVVDSEGWLKNLTVIRSLGHETDSAVLKDVGRWRFTPRKCNGQPVPSEIVIRITFRNP